MSLYQNPQFVNNQPPALNATNMNNLANSAEHSQSYELNFTLSKNSYSEASSSDQAGGVNFWENQNLVVTGTQTSAGDVTVNGSLFKSAVADLEGSYVFSYNTTTSLWKYGEADIAGSNATAIPAYGISGIPTTSDFTVVLTFDPYKIQKVNVVGVTSIMSGSVGVAATATKEQINASGYGQLRCVNQGDGFLEIACYGVTPMVDIPCVIIVDSDGKVSFE